MTMSHQRITIDRNYKNKPNGNSTAENTVPEKKNPLKGLNSRFELSEGK